MFSILQNDVHIDDPRVPEHKLLTAVLLRAIRDYLSSDSKEVRDAEAWLFDGRGHHVPFSFGWVCEQLDLAQKPFTLQLLKLAEGREPGVHCHSEVA